MSCCGAQQAALAHIDSGDAATELAAKQAEADLPIEEPSRRAAAGHDGEEKEDEEEAFTSDGTDTELEEEGKGDDNDAYSGGGEGGQGGGGARSSGVREGRSSRLLDEAVERSTGARTGADNDGDGEYEEESGANPLEEEEERAATQEVGGGGVGGGSASGGEREGEVRPLCAVLNWGDCSNSSQHVPTLLPFRTGNRKCFFFGIRVPRQGLTTLKPTGGAVHSCTSTNAYEGGWIFTVCFNP